jgi:hypothetical protein
MDGIPRLIDMNFKNYMFCTLQKCHEYKTSLYTYTFNIVVFLIFIISFGTVLYFSYKGKKSPKEIEEKMLREQEYVLSKIRYYQNARIAESTGMITDLPFSYKADTVDYLYQ